MKQVKDLKELAISVVHQYYQSEVNNEYVIRGNSAILKCSIPSFVAEFVQVVGWQDDQGGIFNPDERNGTMAVMKLQWNNDACRSLGKVINYEKLSNPLHLCPSNEYGKMKEMEN